MSRRFDFKSILLACLVISIGQLSMGLVFPSLPWIAKDFDVSLEQAQLLVSVCICWVLVRLSLSMAQFQTL